MNSDNAKTQNKAPRTAEYDVTVFLDAITQNRTDIDATIKVPLEAVSNDNTLLIDAQATIQAGNLLSSPDNDMTLITEPPKTIPSPDSESDKTVDATMLIENQQQTQIQEPTQQTQNIPHDNSVLHSTELTVGNNSISINLRPRSISSSLDASGETSKSKISEKGRADFEIIKKLGEGGMGVVYSARQSSIDRPIALKMIKGRAINDIRVKNKFLQEAVVTGDLEHPNIVTIHDLGIDSDGCVFYAMKKVAGKEWAEQIDELSRNENIDILLRTADAIAFAHSKGIIHRDLKPENIMLGSYGEVLVMDWGLAVAISDKGKAEKLNEKTGIAGTPAYLAPEMANPRRWMDVGGHSDIYLLGAILFEIITGKRPHNGKNISMCLKNAADNVIVETGASGELLSIAMKAMSTDIHQRYANVKEFQKAIREYLSHAESILLCEKAESDFAKARISKQYDDFSTAVFGYRQSYELWKENEQALCGIKLSTIAYAQAARDNGDYDLAISLIDKDNFSDCAELRIEIEKLKELRLRQQARHKLFKRTLVAMSVIIIIGSITASVLINSARTQALEERNRAEKNELLAKAESKRANTNEKKAVKALDDLVKAKTSEQLQIALRKAAEVESIKTKKIIKNREELAENKWWIFQNDNARNKQTESAQKDKLPAERLIKFNDDARMDLVLIPDGTFAMGSVITENNRLSEENLHRVHLTAPFYMAKYELTGKQWGALTGDKSQSEGNYPKWNISWDDVQKKLLPAINKYAPQGWTFRLPTEAEWEWACRAGTNTAYNTGNEKQDLEKAGFTGQDNLISAQKVGVKQPNAWGLFDMHGNVAEWCQDDYSADAYLTGDRTVENPLIVNNAANKKIKKKIVRGGSWTNLEAHCRSAHRSYANSDSNYNFIGVRLVLAKK